MLNMTLSGLMIQIWIIEPSHDAMIWIDSDSPLNNTYRQTSNTKRTLVGNKIVDHSDAVEASPVGAALTTSWFSS